MPPRLRKVHGYRKLHDDLLEQGESICPNCIARLTKLAGIKAQIGDKRRPGKFGGKPSIVVDNTLDRQFNMEAPNKVWVTDTIYIRRKRASPTWPLAIVLGPMADKGLDHRPLLAP